MSRFKPLSNEALVLSEVADWAKLMTTDATLLRGSQLHTHAICYVPAGRHVVELTHEEAMIFERHIALPACLDDLLDFPRRVQVAKMKLLIE